MDPREKVVVARGSIFNRTNANGTRTFSIKYRTSDGTQIKKAIGPSRREAERAVTEAIAAVDRGEIRTASRETFAQSAERWMVRKRPVVEESTFRDYEAHLRLRLLPKFGSCQVRPDREIACRGLPRGPGSVRHAQPQDDHDSLIPLRQILARAVRDGVIATNPAANRDRDDPLELPYERPTMHLLNREDTLAYLDAAPAWYPPLA